MKAFDTAEITISHAHAIFSEGFVAVGVYLRSDRTPEAEIDGLDSVGVKKFSIWEKGFPTTPEYFTAEQGLSDATKAVDYALQLGQPASKPIYFCYDVDLTIDDVRDYATSVHNYTKNNGHVAVDFFLTGAYGDEQLLHDLLAEGLIHSAFRAQSRGWEGFGKYDNEMDILQGQTTTVAGLQVDLDNVVNPNVLW